MIVDVELNFFLELLGSGLILGFCFLECNLDLINVFVIYYVANTLISYNCKYTMV